MKYELTKQRTAFLAMLGVSEGTSTSKLTKAEGYDVIVTGVDGPEVFTDFSQHPFANGRKPKVVNSKGLLSTASGKYQFLVLDWPHYRDQLALPDFGPASQDQWALQLINERHGLSAIDTGDFSQAVRLCSNLWASLPGAGYGQRENAMFDLCKAFTAAGGVIA